MTAVLTCPCQGHSERGQAPWPASPRSVSVWCVSQLPSEVTPHLSSCRTASIPHSFLPPHSFLRPHESLHFVPRTTVPRRIIFTCHSSSPLPLQASRLLSFGKEGARSRRHLLQCACYHGFLKRSQVGPFPQLFCQRSHSWVN